MSGKPDYGPSGCCGPAAFAMFFLIVGVFGALGVWVA